MRPQPTEHAPFYATYVSLVPETDILQVLRAQPDELGRLALTVPPEKEGFRYADGKWSIRQVFGHLVDAERVFGYRAYCIGRGETANLPSFDENEYVDNADFDRVPLSELAAEFSATRLSHLPFLKRFDERTVAIQGSASGKPITVRALLYIMAGHVRHHMGIIHDRYRI
jgi:DinB superfamily